MALTVYLTYTHKNVVLNNGRCYKFRYLNYQNDPYPLIFFINVIKGINPNTGHKWNLIQGVNLHYIPASKRLMFSEIWSDTLSRSRMKHFHLTWKFLKMKFPFMDTAIRRYLLEPPSLIQNLVEVKPENLKKELINNIRKDFSIIGRK